MDLHSWSINSLWNQIDSTQLRGLLNQLPTAERTSLQLYFNRFSQLHAPDPEDIAGATLLISVSQALDHLADIIEQIL